MLGCGLRAYVPGWPTLGHSDALRTTMPALNSRSLGSPPVARLSGVVSVTLLIAVLLTPASTLGQNVATLPTAVADADVVQLSPFLVTTSSDIGYIGAQSTLGSRLKQPVKDISSQIEIMTPEFLQDFGLNDVQDAFRYTTNVENTTEYLNPINSADAYFSGQTVGRIRGISTSPFSTTRNLFSSITAADGFNYSRIEVASGAQSMLYGIGQPAGLADVTLNVAEMRDFGSVSFRAGTEGDTRAVADLNKVLLSKRLALRVALLSENNPSFIKPSRDEDNRLYGTLTFRPFKNTTLRVHGERVLEEVNPGITQLPWDYATPFYLAQKQGTEASIATTSFGTLLAAPIYMYGASDAKLNLAHWRTMTYVLNSSQLGYDPARYGTARDPNISAARVTFNPANIGLVPVAAANIGHNFLGDNTENRIKSSIVNVFFEQRLLDTLSFEAGLHRERWDRRLETLIDYANYGFYADINRYVPSIPWPTLATNPTDASHAGYELNPNYGKVYSRGTAAGSWSIKRTDEYRASLVWQPRLERIGGKLGPWLGQHTFVASGSSRETSDKSQGLQSKLVNENLNYQGLVGLTAATAVRRLIQYQYYYDLNHLTMIRPFSNLSLHDYFGNWQLTEPTTGEVLNVAGWGHPFGSIRPSGSKVNVDSLVLAWQGRFLRDRVLLSYGFRRDAAEQYTIDTNVGGPNQLTLGWRWVDQIDFREQPGVTGSNNSHTYSAIVRPLPWMSLSYYQSSTFNLPSGNITPFGDTVPGTFGDSKDYAVRFDFRGGRTFLKFNRYQTDQVANSVSSATVRVNTIAMEKSYRAIVDERSAAKGTPNYYTLIAQEGFSRGVNADTDQNSAALPILGDKVSKGWEVTAGTQAGNWDFRLTGAKNTTLETNVSDDWTRWIQARLPFWKSVIDVNGKGWPETPYQGPTPGSWTVIDKGTGKARTMTMEEYYQSGVVDALVVAQARNNNPVDTARQYRVNLNAAYGFKTGLLKGVRAGAGLRYRSKAILGFAITDLPDPKGGVPRPILDLQRPYYSDPEYGVDCFLSYSGKRFLGSRFGYRIQINGRDLLTGENSFVTGKVNGRGEPTFVYIEQPRSFTSQLTLTF